MKQSNSEKHERFMALLEPCTARLSRYCHAMTKDVDDGRDLLSDAILLAYENFEQLRVSEAFTSYIFTTARRLYYRRARRKKWWSVLDRSSEVIADDRNQSPEISLDIELLDQALAKLPEKQREAVVLFEISGLSLAEVCEIQGGSLSGVKSRIVRGREKLAVLLGERERLGTAVHQQPGTAAPRDSSFEYSQVAYLIKEKI